MQLFCKYTGRSYVRIYWGHWTNKEYKNFRCHSLTFLVEVVTCIDVWISNSISQNIRFTPKTSIYLFLFVPSKTFDQSFFFAISFSLFSVSTHWEKQVVQFNKNRDSLSMKHLIIHNSTCTNKCTNLNYTPNSKLHASLEYQELEIVNEKT